jgi:predicted nucleotidyltransferase
MFELTSQQCDTIQRLCGQYAIQRFELFGSAARDDFIPDRSDLDFLVTFDPCESMNLFDRYFGLKEDLEKLFHRKIDLVDAAAMRNPYFIRELNRSRIPIHVSPTSQVSA